MHYDLTSRLWKESVQDANIAKLAQHEDLVVLDGKNCRERLFAAFVLNIQLQPLYTLHLPLLGTVLPTGKSWDSGAVKIGVAESIVTWCLRLFVH